MNENTQRPKEVSNALLILWITTFGFGILRSAMEFSRLSEQTAQLGGPIFVIAIQAFSFLWIGAILFFLGRRSRVALWIYTVLFVIGVPMSILPLVASLKNEPISGAMGILQFLAQGFALYLLFSAPARAWFKPTSTPPVPVPPSE